jgi:NitT/TauT family transport system permease protein
MKKLIQNLGPPVLLAMLVLVVWQAVVSLFDIAAFLLPSPIAVSQAAWEDRSKLATATWITASAALSGFGLSLILGTSIALVFSQSRIVRASCYPYAIFLQTVPIIAIAPLIVIWIGFGFQSVVVIAIIISLFPIITNTTTVLVNIDPQQLSVFRLYHASRWQLLWKLRLPTAIPHIITGAKISSGLTVIGAIVGEFFAGFDSNRVGLGNMVDGLNSQLKTDLMFAVVILSALLGMLIFGTVSLCGAAILSRWYDIDDS